MNKQKEICVYLLVCIIISTFSFQAAAVHDTTQPEWRLQGQNKTIIEPDESIHLYAQGRDNMGLNYAYLATNETGEWQQYTGLPGWRYSKRIIIHHKFVAGDLINFPVLISLVSSDFCTHAQAGGNDFLFTSIDNEKLNHEIEYYNTETGELVAWVQIPFLSSSEDTILYLYYGNPECENQENVQDTWDDGFVAVYHMNGADYMDLYDSTHNNYNITFKGGSPMFNQPGVVGRSVRFKGAGDYLQSNVFRLPANTSYTASAWVYVDGSHNTRREVFSGIFPAFYVQISTNNRMLNLARTNISAFSSHSDTVIDSANPEWYYVVSRANTENNDLALLINGVMERNIPFTGELLSEDLGLNIGTRHNPNTAWMIGRIDEIRFSAVARSDAWIKTEYNNIVSPTTFISVYDWSPLKMQENNHWQWSNFTWSNPNLPIGTTVGWRIYYTDTSGNSIATPIKSFTIFRENNPPPTPNPPAGETSGVVGGKYLYTVPPVVDPDGDKVSYYFDWGDGTSSGWISVPYDTHSWDQMGLFFVRVKAKDHHGAESGWSSPLPVTMISYDFPQLVIASASTVVEGGNFIVIVTSDGVPVHQAQLLFLGETYITNVNGQATIVAPSVNQVTTYSLSASKPGYQPTTIMLSIVPQDDYTPNGWIYGMVYSTTDEAIEGATVCVFLRDEKISPICTSTDDQGKYIVHVPVGTYKIQVSKPGYILGQKHTVIVQENAAIGINVQLKKAAEDDPRLGKDFIDYAIKYGINEGIVGGEITIPQGQQGSHIIYDARLSLAIHSIDEQGVFQFRVSGPHGSQGTVVAVRIDKPDEVFHTSIQQIQDIVVEFDGKPIARAHASEDLFSSFSTSSSPLWGGLITEKLSILVAIPEFSEHEITIRTHSQIPGISGILAAIIYGTVSICVIGILVLPFLVGIIRRRRYLRE